MHFRTLESMEKYFVIIIFICFMTTVYSARKVMCNSNQPIVYMNTDELVFFESPSFPKGMTEDCNIIFMLKNDENVTNLRTWIMFTNGRFHNPSVSNNGTEYYPQILLPNIHSFVLNVTEVSIYTAKDLSYSSFQGYIMFDDWTPGCPLESISKIDPFVFTDETEILFLIPTFIQTNTSNPGGFFESIELNNCTWKFIAPTHFGFKLLIGMIDSPNAIIEIRAGDIETHVFTKDSFTAYQPYYFYQPFLQIRFHDNFQGNYLPEFQAFLSVLKINPEITDAECTFNEDEPSFKKWGINNGYPNNAKCLLNLTLLSSDYLYYISVQSASRNLDGLPNEFGVDRLTLYTRDKNIQMNDKFTQINRIDFEYVLQAHKNGYNKYAALEFISDGSVSSQGFEVNFEKVECKCNSQTIYVPCQGLFDYYTIMEGRDDYCGYLDCTFNINFDPDCTDKLINIFFLIKVSPPFDSAYEACHLSGTCVAPPFDDELSVTSNNKTMLKTKMNYNQDDTFFTLLSPKNVNIIKFTSLTKTYRRELNIDLQTVDASIRVKNVTLSYDKPMYVLDIAGIDLNSAILIQLDDDLKSKNDTLEIFLNLRNQHLQCVMFYYDLNFDSYEFDYNSFFDKSKDSKSYQSAHPYLYVYKISTKMCKTEDYGILLLRARNAHTKNCAFKDNVFDAFNAAKYNKIISFLANENGTCEIILLNLPTSYNNLPMDQQVIRGVLHVITHFWTTSIYENVKIYIGSLKKELMLEFNQTEKEPLNAMLLSSQYYTILLPKNSSLVLQCNEIPINPINLIYPYKGIWSSPFYGTFPSGPISRTILGKFYIPKNIVMTIKILEFNTSAALLFKGPNTTIYANGSSKIYSFTEYLTIIFGQNNNAFTGVLMEIETKKKDKNL